MPPKDSSSSPKPPVQLALEMEQDVQVQRTAYEAVLEAFATDAPTTQDDWRKCLDDLHQAGVAYFNAFEHSVTSSSLLQAHEDTTWYSNQGETAINLLGTILRHFRGIKEKAKSAGLSRTGFWPGSHWFYCLAE